MSAAGQLVPALSTEVLRVAFGQSSPVVIRTNEGGIFSVGIPGYELPTDGNGRVWVYFGLHDKARYVSAKDVLKAPSRDRFAATLVLVGTSAIGLLDLKTTPVDGAMPGVEVHAQVLESALSRTCPRPIRL